MTFNHAPQPPQSIDHREVGGAFRIGQPELTQEFIENGRRFLAWVPVGNEAKFKDFAGWGLLPFRQTPDGLMAIEVPEGTRSAGSILGGKEAWEGEKREVLTAIAKYTGRMFRLHGVIDGNTSLDTFAVTKERFSFATPPHIEIQDPTAMETWLEHMKSDISAAASVEADTALEELIDGFVQTVQQETRM